MNNPIESHDLDLDGNALIVSIYYDDDGEPPWKRSDGHGPVSEWTTRDKRPGELVLSEDGFSRRYYDLAKANQLAKEQGWGLSDAAKVVLLHRLCQPRIQRYRENAQSPWHTRTIRRDPDKPLTKGEIRAGAVMNDFEFLKGWCDDSWQYVGVSVRRKGTEEEFKHACWGLENSDTAYVMEVAIECARDLLAVEAREAKELAEFQHAQDLNL